MDTAVAEGVSAVCVGGEAEVILADEAEQMGDGEVGEVIHVVVFVMFSI